MMQRGKEREEREKRTIQPVVFILATLEMNNNNNNEKEKHSHRTVKEACLEQTRYQKYQKIFSSLKNNPSWTGTVLHQTLEGLCIAIKMSMTDQLVSTARFA